VDKPANSHVALNTIVDVDGTERQIVRDNMPFGSAGDGTFGTYFIGYAGSPEVIEQMLENMFVGRPPGNTDRILDFSTAVSGSLFFVPSADLLEALPPPAGAERAGDDRADAEQAGTERADADPVASEEPVVTPDESLGIGSLKGSPA